MKRMISLYLMVCLFVSLAIPSFAEPIQGAVSELYSAEGNYEDSVGNRENYSYHVPQIVSSSSAAEEINSEIEEQFGKWIEEQFENMKAGYSLWSWNTEWHSYWNGSQLFLLITQDSDGGFVNYAAYGYDFETQSRVTNQMILDQMGISNEVYLTNLKEKVQLMFEDMNRTVPENLRKEWGYDELLEKTLNWADIDQPIFINGFGEIETIVKIASFAGAEWYYHLATPFSYG